MSLIRKTILASAFVAATGIATATSAAPLGGAVTDTGAVLKAEAAGNRAVDNVRWVCRYGYHGKRCWWQQPQVFGFYYGPRRHGFYGGHSFYGGSRRWH